MAVLFTYPLAYNPFKAALALEEKGVPYSPRVVDLFNGASLAPDFMRLNPQGSVPVLQIKAQDKDVLITDSRQIVDYVNSLPPGPLGGDAVDQQLVASWVDRLAAWDGNLFLAANSDPGAAKVLGLLQTFKVRYAQARAREHPELQQAYEDKIKGLQAADAQMADAAAGDANRAQLTKLLDDAEQQLAAAGPYLAGSELSAADVLFTPLLFRLGMAGKTGEYLKPRPHVSDYLKRMEQRPSFERVFGPARSKLTAARLLLPALVKAAFANATGWY